MKIVYSIFLLLFAMKAANGQKTVLVPDQNPAYMASQQRYMKAADSLSRTLGITLQETYKAYDWYEARLERRQQRREWRHEEKLNRRHLKYNCSSGYYYPYQRRYSSFHRMSSHGWFY